MNPVIKVLIIATSHGTMGASSEATGVWLEELTTPYYTFVDAGAEVTIASIGGGMIPIDPRSIRAKGENEASVERYLADPMLQTSVRSTPPFVAAMADGYDAVFLPGGHGTMWDYPTSPEVAKVVVNFLTQGKAVAAVCHGPAGLVSARLADGTSIVAGRRVAGFTNSEERAAGLDAVVPFLLETRLRELGAVYLNGPDFAPFVVRDANLITGQNPASAREAARLTLEAVSETRRVGGEQ